MKVELPDDGRLLMDGKTTTAIGRGSKKKQTKQMEGGRGFGEKTMKISSTGSLGFGSRGPT